MLFSNAQIHHNPNCLTLWHSTLSCFSWHWYSSWALVQISAASPLTHLLAHVPGKAAQDIPFCLLASAWQTRLLWPFVNHLVNEPKDGKYLPLSLFFSLLLILPPSLPYSVPLSDSLSLLIIIFFWKLCYRFLLYNYTTKLQNNIFGL